MLSEIRITPLKIIEHSLGNIMHALKKNEKEFTTFGEAYFTFIRQDQIKGIKMHKKMTLNLIVPIGVVKFYCFNKDFTEKKIFEIGEENYSRLTIPPNIWVAFKGISNGKNLILNIANIEHDPNESISVELKNYINLF